MPVERPLKVAVLVDLPRSALSGGHVKGWEYRAKAVAASDMPLDMTIFFSGEAKTEVLSDKVTLKQLPPVFSTARLRAILPYTPDDTDLAPYHKELAKELMAFDVIHTTDAYFAFSKTAEKVAKKHDIPMVTSFHTDTPSYANIFTRKTINSLFRNTWISRFLNDICKIPERQEQKMIRRLKTHLSHCSEALFIRPEDLAYVNSVIGSAHAHPMRAVVDKNRFTPSRRNHKEVDRRYGIPSGDILIVFVGRLDIGKNIYTLIEAIERLLKEDVRVHLFAAGVGPAEADLKNRLKGHVSVPGFVAPDDLATVMASADILALCSEVEIRSLVVLEAMATGLPVALAAKSGIADLIPEAKEAVTIVEGKGEAWANALKMLAADAQKRETMSKAALDYAQTHIADWETIMREDFLKTWQKAYTTKSKSTTQRS